MDEDELQEKNDHQSTPTVCDDSIPEDSVNNEDESVIDVVDNTRPVDTKVEPNEPSIHDHQNFQNLVQQYQDFCHDELNKLRDEDPDIDHEEQCLDGPNDKTLNEQLTQGSSQHDQFIGDENYDEYISVDEPGQDEHYQEAVDPNGNYVQTIINATNLQTNKQTIYVPFPDLPTSTRSHHNKKCNSRNCSKMRSNHRGSDHVMPGVPKLNLSQLEPTILSSDSDNSARSADFNLELFKSMFGSSPSVSPIVSPFPFYPPPYYQYPYIGHYHPAFISPRGPPVLHESPRDPNILKPTAHFPPIVPGAGYTAHRFIPNPIPTHSQEQEQEQEQPVPAPKLKRNPKSSDEHVPVKRIRKTVKRVPVRRVFSCNFKNSDDVSMCNDSFMTSQQLVCHIANLHSSEADHACNNCAKYSKIKLQMLLEKIENEKQRSNIVPSFSTDNS